MRRVLLLAAATCLTPPLAAQTVITDAANHTITADMRTLPMHIGGRAQATALPPPMPKGATAYRHEWPAIYFEGAFVGDQVVLKFDDASHEYRLMIDDASPITLFRPGNVEINIGDLGPKAHTLRLEGVSESFLGPGSFEGFYVRKNERPLAVKPRRRQIEFIGPSGTAGFGARSHKTECSFDELARTSDTQQAYSALVAKHYGADYQINANSGHGLIRNVREARKEPGLIALYPRILPDQTTLYADPKWQPQIIDIQGLADVSVGDVEPGEKWATLDALIDDWVLAYRGFIADLHRRSPRAALLIDWPDDGSIPPVYRERFGTAKQALAAEAQRDGVRMILFPEPTLLMSRMELTGCDHHPNLKDHRLNADWLIAIIDAHPGIWDGK